LLPTTFRALAHTSSHENSMRHGGCRHGVSGSSGVAQERRASGRWSRAIHVLAALFILTSPSAAVAIPIGVVSFDTLIPGPDGVNAFNIANLTEAFGLPPDFPVVDPVTFLSSSLSLTYQDGSTSTIDLMDIGPGFADNPNLFFADSVLFSSATFTATLSSLDFLLADGTTFQAASNLISVVLSPATGLLLSPGDFAVIDIEGEIRDEEIPSVPEPSTLVLLASGIAAGLTLRRRKMNRR
jgi:hypothetical protein